MDVEGDTASKVVLSVFADVVEAVYFFIAFVLISLRSMM